MAPPADLKIYGQTHSPWVQAALLGASLKGLPHQLITATPLPVLAKWGVLMPAAKFGSDDWMRDSPNILEHMGYEAIEPELMA